MFDDGIRVWIFQASPEYLLPALAQQDARNTGYVNAFFQHEKTGCRMCGLVHASIDEWYECCVELIR